ncbi:hypothetical protein ABEB36_001632 [Hypothenemus hampei]|uniref:Caspase family p20 domain-containing protein n=1 Tax=Hypothenemus hampei TaxID=57062 RepID=A0ABD1FF70_HYPHA
MADSEKVEVKPPIDLIPDEYPRLKNSKILVEMLCHSDDSNECELQKCLEANNYTVIVTNQKNLDTIDEEWLSNVHNKIMKDNYEGSILIFRKVDYSTRDMKKIWSSFTTKMCPYLKNKPKIFIFQLAKSKIGKDYTAADLNWKSCYDTPAEADMLIVQDLYGTDREDFLVRLSKLINRYGGSEDIFTLTSYTSEGTYQPMVISTMTRRFFFKLHDVRGHHTYLKEHHDKAIKSIEEIKKHALRKGGSKNANVSLSRRSSERVTSKEGNVTRQVIKPKENKLQVTNEQHSNVKKDSTKVVVKKRNNSEKSSSSKTDTVKPIWRY